MADRNLLLGILALRNEMIARDALLAGLDAWFSARGKPLGQVLVEQQSLTAAQRTILEGLVADRVRQQEQDDEQADPHATKPYDGPPPVPVRYHILEPHRRGGLGEVFVAHDEELGRKVALKQIRDEYADHPDSRARFLLEAEITGGLEHPGIVPVYGLGCYADGRPFYAMRFIRGESLREALQRFHEAEQPDRDPGERALALRGLLNRFVDVCNALAYAHSRGVLHRDLKPSNVMLGPYGETLVVDWGLAKLLAADLAAEGGQELLRPTLASGSAPTQAGSGVGTPEYMAPEQAAGRADALGPHTDIYGLGAILFEILTGRPPHDRRVRTPDPPRAQAVKPSVPAALDDIAAKAMNPGPADRYPSASALAEAVQRWLAEEPVASYRALVGRLEGLARSQPDVLDYSEELARNRVNLGLVLSGMGRYTDAEESFRSAIAEYEALASARSTTARYRADLATARLHLSQALAALQRPDEAEQARKAAVADYDWLMATNPHDYRTNLASVIITLMPRPHESTPQTVANLAADGLPTSIPPAATEAAVRAPDSTIPPQTGQAVPMPERLAELRARFTRISVLGRGGSASVWIARDNDLNREVALKESLENDPATRQRFLKEAQVTAQLEHPNIVPIHGLGYRSHDDAPFLIMRYVRGHDLRQAIQEYHSRPGDAQELRRLLRAFVGACNGVTFAHSRGVLHRDPKPANIILGNNGEVVVVDWGLAKVQGDQSGQASEVRKVVLGEWADPGLTAEGDIMGTPAYMAPEMVQGRHDLVDARTDVYVLGAGLFEVLTGQTPYQGQYVNQIFDAILTFEPPRPRSVNPSVPPPLNAICARAMARQREDRYLSAAELGQDVERWLNGEPVSVYPESFLKRWGRRLRGH